tara:strand:+ start:1030 stop:1218 length:189 start_codon:yes stop_codon:yes gene_type:complete
MVYKEALKIISSADNWELDGIDTTFPFQKPVRIRLIETEPNGKKQTYILTKREVSKLVSQLF